MLEDKIVEQDCEHDSEIEDIPIFSDQYKVGQGSFDQGVRDQFAMSLLRLQQDLDLTNRKLSEVENKIDAIKRQRLNMQTNRHNGNPMYTLMYFGWPVVVFIAIRAFERRWNKQ